MRDRDREIDALFDRFLDAPPGEREALLAGRNDLRADVEALLAAHEAMGGEFLATPAGDCFQACCFEPGDRIGRNTVRRRIAAGGAGTVYEAEQDQPHRTIALKVMHAGLGSERAQRRFQDEAETLARLDHLGIAHVYEAGVHEGVPYIAIELVAGARTLLEHGRDLDRRGRLRLFAEVCDAVHHGHQQGIIHRDLKPANILVKADRPKVVDFGIARLEESDESEIAGTVAYMSPEQCEAGVHLDVRSDVYSLGVVLYELLRGCLPYDVSTTSITDAARVIRESPPRPLGIDRDLDAIVERARARVSLLGHSQMVTGLAFSPDGSRLASASADGTVRVWDPGRGTLLLVLRGHRIHASCVTWSADGSTLASGGGDHGEDACTVRLWEAPASVETGGPFPTR